MYMRNNRMEFKTIKGNTIYRTPQGDLYKDPNDYLFICGNPGEGITYRILPNGNIEKIVGIDVYPTHTCCGIRTSCTQKEAAAVYRAFEQSKPTIINVDWTTKDVEDYKDRSRIS